MIGCPSTTCTQTVDVIIKDVLISGLSDEEVKMEVFGQHNLDQKTIDQTVHFIEAKEMARSALPRSSTMSSISSYRKNVRSTKVPTGASDITTRPCIVCSTQIEKLIWGRRQKKMVDRKFCPTCWSEQIRKKQQHKEVNAVADMDSALTIGSIDAIKPLNHLLFDTESGWKDAKSFDHPTLALTVHINDQDYENMNRKPPSINSFTISVVTDTGAQSCLWGLSNFLQAGFTTADLIPVRHSLYAANKEKIPISGAILLRLSGSSSTGQNHTAAVMTYISPSSNKFYLSREALVQLDVISQTFPQLGGALHQSAIHDQPASCDCPKRTKPPSRPAKLPFECIPSNNNKMCEWLIDYFSVSTFNQCPHQELPGMTGPEVTLHIDDDAVPYAAHTPAPVPLHWQDAVKEQLDNDVAMGVPEKVQIEVPSQWCHRMVITSKADGSPRRTVDLSPLNAFCLRETHHVQPPFQQAKKVPSNSWKSVTDAWNGFHSFQYALKIAVILHSLRPGGDTVTGSHHKASSQVETLTPEDLMR